MNFLEVEKVEYILNGFAKFFFYFYTTENVVFENVIYFKIHSRNFSRKNF